eukprot:g536.t1
MPGSDAQDLWTVDKSRLGKRPDCTPIKVKSTATTNYLYQTTAKCKEKCVEETEGKCNFISRYQQSNKNDESLWHCRFYTCSDPSNVNYVDQTSWGNGAGQSYLLKIMSRHYQNDDDNDGDQQFPEPNSIQYGSSSKSAIVPNQRNRTENDNVKKTKQEPDTVSVIILCLICFIIGFLSAVIVYYIMNMCSDCFKCIIKTNKRDTKDDSSKKSSSKPDKLNLKPDNYEHDYELGITKSTNNLSTFNTIKPILTSLKRSISKEFNNSPFNMHHKKSKKTPPPWPCKNENNKNTDNIDNLATASVIRIQI